MRGTLVETLIGAVVLVVAGLFLYYAYSGSGYTEGDGYKIIADFERIDGLTVGADVRISGIKVGTVTQQALDPVSYGAKVTMKISESVELPIDTYAKISMDGLLGSAYVSLSPGGAIDILQDGDEMDEPGQGSIDLMDLVGQLIHGTVSEDE